MSEKIDLRSSGYRRQLLLQLKDYVKQLMPYVHNKEVQVLHEEVPIISSLCNLLEIIFIHAIKLPEISTALPVWHMIERLYLLQPPCYALQQTVQVIMSMTPCLHSCVGKFRGWVRHTLNSQLLEECLVFIFSQTTLLSKFYAPEAIFMQPEDQQILIAIIRSLKVFTFRINIEEKAELNHLPAHLQDFLEKMTSSSTASSTSIERESVESRRSSLSGSSPPSVSLLGNQSPAAQQEASFLRSFEDRLDRMIDNLWTSSGTASSGSPPNQKMVSSLPSTSKAPTPLFQHTPLKYLLYDEFRCTHANLQPHLGIPNQIRKCLTLLSQHVDYPNFFRQSVSQPQILDLKRLLELESNDIPAQLYTIPNMSYLLMNWLLQLPEPLLGYAHYEAYLTVSSMDELAQRTHTYSMLLVDTPWYNKPLVIQLITLLKKLLSPTAMASNQLNPIAVSTLFTPCFLRPRLTKKSESLSIEEVEQWHWQAILQASSVFQELLLHADEVFAPLQQELQEKQVHLMQKCSFIRHLQDGLLQGFPLIVFDLTENNSSYTNDSKGSDESVSVKDNVVPNTAAVAVGSNVKTNNIKGKRMVAVVFHKNVRIGNEGSNADVEQSEEMLTPEEDELIRKLWHTLCLVDHKIRSTMTIAHPSTKTSSDNKASSSNSAQEDIDGDLIEAQDEGGLIREVAIPPYPEDLYAQMSILEIMKHPRWHRCGFPVLYHASHLQHHGDEETLSHSTNSGSRKGYFLSEFHCYEGSLAIQSLTQFMHKYPEKSATIMIEFLRYRQRHCSFVQVVMQVTSLVGEVLQLLPQPLHHPHSNKPVHHHHQSHASTNNNIAPVQYLAKLPVWSLLNDSNTFQEIFDIGILCFDEMWKNNTERIGELPHGDTYAVVLTRTKSLLWEIMLHQPGNIHQIWEIWMNLRLQEEEQIFQILQPTPIKAQSKDYLPQPAANGKTKENKTESHTQEVLMSEITPPMLHSSMQRGKLHILGDDSGDEDSSDEEGVVDQVKEEKAAVKAVNQSYNDHPNDEKESIYSIERIVIKPRSGAHDAVSTARPSLEHADTATGLVLDNFSHLSSSSLARGDTMSMGPISSSNVNTTAEEEELTGMNEHHNVRVALAEQAKELQNVLDKVYGGITTRVFGGSKILNLTQIHHLEAALPSMYQCYQWKLLYRMSLDGASLSTLQARAKNHPHTLLVVQDSQGAIFGALLTEALRVAERDKYYGNGTMGVWSLASGVMRYYPWSYHNNYFVVSSKELLGIGGGGHFAIFLDAELNQGSSGQCKTFNSPCLAASEEFVCVGCELFALEA